MFKYYLDWVTDPKIKEQIGYNKHKTNILDSLNKRIKRFVLTFDPDSNAPIYVNMTNPKGGWRHVLANGTLYSIEDVKYIHQHIVAYIILYKGFKLTYERWYDNPSTDLVCLQSDFDNPFRLYLSDSYEIKAKRFYEQWQNQEKIEKRLQQINSKYRFIPEIIH